MSASSSLQAIVQQKLTGHFSRICSVTFTAVGGGSINDAYRVSFDDKSVFCKINSASEFPRLFQKEKHGLELVATQNAIGTPLVIDCFEESGFQFLLLEWIQAGSRTEAFWETFGEQLAALHQVSNVHFGLGEDNYMGSVPQQNKHHESWPAFFSSERLQPMVKRCADKKQLRKSHLLQFDSLTKNLAAVFADEKPSLLHGDLWSGNFMCNHASEPVLIDPAVYFGHRSADLGMTTLFGGFRSAFYEAYHYHLPLPPNHEEQRAVCNLYPLLIHLYLFGSGYLPQIEQTLRRFA